jgi:hypothetical protein
VGQHNGQNIVDTRVGIQYYLTAIGHGLSLQEMACPWYPRAGQSETDLLTL